MVKIIFIGEGKHPTGNYIHQLTQAGFEIKSVKSGIAGLKILHDEKFDLVLIDIMLHDIHGLDLLKKLRLTNPNPTTPIVILADTSLDSIIRESFALGAKGYLVKEHHTPAQVVDYIKNMLHK